MPTIGPKKIHPSCTPPTVPGVPDAAAAMNAAVAKLAGFLTPTTILARVAANTARLNRELDFYAAQARERTAAIEKMSSNPCPLPKVPDKAAKRS